MQPETESNRAASNVLPPSVAIVGGGLAGIAAAVEAIRQGARVVLFERKRRLGGRASSIDFGAVSDSGSSSATVDVGQRVILGSCRRLRRLHSDLNLDDCFNALDSVPILSLQSKKTFESSQIWNLAAASCASSAKFRLSDLLTLSKSGPLSFNERRNFLAVCRELVESATPNDFDDLTQTFADFLRESTASEKSIGAFWRPFALSATAETPEIAAFDAVKRFFVDAFAQGKNAAPISLPNRPLREIYHFRTLAALEKLGADVRFLSRVERLETRASAENALQKREIVGVWNAGRFENFDKVVLAVDPFEARALLERSELTEIAESVQISQYECGAITAVHFWLDRPLTESRAIFLDGEPAQRLFASPDGAPRPFPTSKSETPFNPDAETTENSNSTSESPTPDAYYYQATIGAAHRLLSETEISERGKNALIERVWSQLSERFPQTAADAKILATRTSTALDAVISPSPAFLRSRPAQKTNYANLALAGDWTATDFPSSMEGAVSSGVQAIAALFD